MSEFPVLEFMSAGVSDVGSVRKLNEDSWIERPEIGLWAVADGMGGHQSGDLASRTIVHHLDMVSQPESAQDLLARVQRAILEANDALIDAGHARGEGSVIGATVVALMVHGTHFACTWAGDSRLYRFRAGQLVQMTRDHSQVQDLIDAGMISPEEAERHPVANVITRAVGAHKELRLDTVSHEIEAGDLYLVCTDGLTRMVSDQRIAAILGETDLGGQPAALLAAALANGGKDNVTAIVVAAQRHA